MASPANENSELEEEDPVTENEHRNRGSLPAYSSLSISRSHKGPPAVYALAFPAELFVSGDPPALPILS